jgi:hypothetical protein
MSNGYVRVDVSLRVVVMLTDFDSSQSIDDVRAEAGRKAVEKLCTVLSDGQKAGATPGTKFCTIREPLNVESVVYGINDAYDAQGKEKKTT